MKQKIILTDCDGVVLDWEEGFQYGWKDTKKLMVICI